MVGVPRFAGIYSGESYVDMTGLGNEYILGTLGFSVQSEKALNPFH